ncbi:tetratricopeptide repeat protein [Luteitalea pratensis]|uniref:Tetratricopeptide repeat protein n=1 Tax=Luteitalea pratensis TaxID=1855912 RepID=A0A143PIX4_LUTPR|nr:tetratricopeptide repeat protein [Luteitalea pratensis]AMY08461.1 tetratricopeptide repeat protein [Luteitalea pratensis]
MKHWMFVLAGLVFAATAASGCQRRATSAHAVAAITTDACAAALAPGSGRSDRDRAITQAQQQAGARGATRDAFERLGYLYVARARVANDPGDYTLADLAAGCLESRYPGDAGALLLKGHVLHQLHRFSEAERIARTLVARRTVVLDYGLLGDTLMEQGRLAEAAEAYQRMLDLKPFYQSYTRAAHLRWLRGDLEGAIESIRLAIASASPRDPESAAWAWTRLAVYELQAARFTAARAAADSALRYQPDYAAAHLARGRVLLAIGRHADAIPILREATRLNPVPEYQWLLADALRLEGRGSEAEEVEQELMTRGAIADPRTHALYLATRRISVPRALALTQEELQARADVFTLDARAWALAASGRVAEAHQIISRALAEGTQDARLFLHAGVISAAAGRDREARQWLGRAEQLRPMLLPSEASELTRRLMNNPKT